MIGNSSSSQHRLISCSGRESEDHLTVICGWMHVSSPLRPEMDLMTMISALSRHLQDVAVPGLLSNFACSPVCEFFLSVCDGSLIDISHCKIPAERIDFFCRASWLYTHSMLNTPHQTCKGLYLRSILVLGKLKTWRFLHLRYTTGSMGWSPSVANGTWAFIIMFHSDQDTSA